MKTELLFKVLDEKGLPYNGGKGKWNPPQGKRPGKWMPKIKKLVPCDSGYHLCRESDLVLWLGPRIFLAECRGERVDVDDKIVVSEARLIRECKAWDEKTARLFACDCAERVLPIFEKAYPKDGRPRAAIETARLFAGGKATQEELAAAWDAARAAARAAARDAAWDAARAAARAAAWDAAWDAAWAAAWAAAWDAERKWQTNLLMSYLEVK
jgi:hypothetical protein